MIVGAPIMMVVGVNMKEYQPDFMKDMQGGDETTATSTDTGGDG